MAPPRLIPPKFGTFARLDWEVVPNVVKTAGFVVFTEVTSVIFGDVAQPHLPTNWILETPLSLDSSLDSVLVFTTELRGSSSVSNPTDTDYLVDNIAVVTEIGTGSGGNISVFDEGGLVTSDARELDFIGQAVSTALSSPSRVGVIVSGSGGTGSGFLPSPDEFDETDLTFFYYGWESVAGEWFIRRARRDGPIREDAPQSNNPAYASLTLAWPNRQTLTYS